MLGVAIAAKISVRLSPLGGRTGRLSHIPAANLARKFAEQGATTTRSAHLLSCCSAHITVAHQVTHLDMKYGISQLFPVLDYQFQTLTFE